MRNMKENSWPRLRPANNKDREDVANLVFNILKEYNLRPDPQSTNADLKNIERSYFERGGAFCVLEETDRSIIGAY
jgi:putative acetyltransferase